MNIVVIQFPCGKSLVTIGYEGQGVDNFITGVGVNHETLSVNIKQQVVTAV
jgi:hypothetical protein